MAREGFEPSKPLGRQIYSLLRLTASLPRPNSSAGCRLLVPPHFSGGFAIRDKSRFNFPNRISLEREKFRATCDPGLSFSVARNLELAKGFEPPTR